MTEPMPERHETWGEFLARKLAEKDSIDVAWESAEWWEREQMRDARAVLRMEIGTAIARLGIADRDIDW